MSKLDLPETSDYCLLEEPATVFSQKLGFIDVLSWNEISCPRNGLEKPRLNKIDCKNALLKHLEVSKG